MKKITLNYDNSFTEQYVTEQTINLELTTTGGMGKNRGLSLPRTTQGTWWDTDWSNRTVCTVDHDKVDSNLTNFRLCIILNSDNFDFSVAKMNGEDIRIVDSDDTTELTYEIRYYNKAAQEAVIFCVVPSILAASDDTIYVYYGNESATDNQSVTGVWNSDFVAVLTLDETTGTFLDLTANNNDGTNHGSKYEDGKLNACRYFDGVDDYINIADAASQDVTGHLTMSVIAYPNTPSSATARWVIVHDMSARKYSLQMNQGGTWIAQVNTGSSYNCTGTIDTRAAWNLISGTFDRTLGANRLILYVNASQDAQNNAADADIAAGDEGVKICQTFTGGQYFYWPGYIDEIRIENVTRSQAWHNARYYAEITQNLITYSQETYTYTSSLTGSYDARIEPGMFGDSGLSFPIRFNTAVKEDGWVGIVCYGAEYDGTLEVKVFERPDVFPLKFPIKFGNLFATESINKLIDLRPGTNKFPLTFPIQFGFHGKTLIVQVNFSVTSSTDIPPVLEKIEMYYEATDEAKTSGTVPLLNGYAITQVLPITVSYDTNVSVIPVLGSTTPIAYRTYAHSRTYSFTIQTRSETLVENLVSSLESGTSVTWTTKAFNDEWEDKTVQIIDMSEVQPISDFFEMTITLREVL